MSIAFVNAHVITGNGRELDTGTVVIENGRIVSVGENGFAADVVVDLEGRALMPGLIDLHTHMVGGDNAMGFGDEAISFRMHDPLPLAALESVAAARTTLHAGITTVREIGGRDFVDVAMKRAQAEGKIEGPRMLATGSAISMTGGHGSFWAPQRTSDGRTAIVERVRELVGNGVDVIKVVSSDGPETLGRWDTVQSTFDEVQSAFAEARRLGRRTAAHAMGPAAIGNVVAAGVDTVEHGSLLSEENCRLMVERGTYLVPTLGNILNIIRYGPGLNMPWVDTLSPEEDAIFERAAMAVELGVKIAMGSDCGGNEAHRHGENLLELDCYVRCGMTPVQAIEAGTLEAARAVWLDAELGSIEAGKLADLVVVDGDPSADIGLVRTALVGVVQGGRVIRDDLGLLDEARRAGSRPAAV